MKVSKRCWLKATRPARGDFLLHSPVDQWLMTTGTFTSLGSKQGSEMKIERLFFRWRSFAKKGRDVRSTLFHQNEGTQESNTWHERIHAPQRRRTLSSARESHRRNVVKSSNSTQWLLSHSPWWFLLIHVKPESLPMEDVQYLQKQARLSTACESNERNRPYVHWILKIQTE